MGIFSRDSAQLKVLEHSVYVFYLKGIHMCQPSICTMLSLLKHCQELLVLLGYLAIVHLQTQKINTLGYTGHIQPVRSIRYVYRPLYTQIVKSSPFHLLRPQTPVHTFRCLSYWPMEHRSASKQVLEFPSINRPGTMDPSHILLLTQSFYHYRVPCWSEV